MVQGKKPFLVDEPEKPSNKDGVQLGIYLSYVKNELDNENACLELPFTLLVLISFSVFALLHLKQHDTYVVEMAWKEDIEQNANFAWTLNFGHKSLYDVNSMADFWSWLRLGFVPLVARASWAFSEELGQAYPSGSNFSFSQLPENYTLDYGTEPDEPWGQATLPVQGEFSNFNRIVAGVRMRQERAAGDWASCKMPGSVPEQMTRSWLGKPCMPADPPYELTPEAGHAEVLVNPQRVEWLPKSPKDMELAVQDLESGCTGNSNCTGPWLDEYTQRVEIGIVSYNQNYGLISLVTVNFFFNRAGHIYQLIHVQSAWSRWLLGNFLEQFAMVMADVVWLSALLFLFLSEVRELAGVVRSAKRGIYEAIFHDYLNFWNAVDWVSIICAYAVIGTYVRLIMETGATTETMAAYTAQDASLTSEAWRSRVFESVESVVLAEADFRFTLMFYPIVVVVRLLKSFDAQPRLAVVTKTLYTAWKDLLHFFIVFFSVYFCLAVNSVLVFGQDMEHFATLDRGVIACFRAMFGDWDWPRMQTIGVGRVVAALWIWLFVVLVVVLLLNMMLAILLDSYSDVKSTTSSMTTLNTQISEMLRRRRQSTNNERVTLSDIWAAYLEKLGDEKMMLDSTELVTAEDIMQQVEGCPKSQAKRTLVSAQQSWEKSMEAPYTSGIFMEQLKLCGVRLALLHRNTRYIRGVFSTVADHVGLSENAVAVQETASRVMTMVQLNVKTMSKQVDEILREECSSFEDRQEVICGQQRDFTEVVRQTKGKLTSLQQEVQKVKGSLQSVAAHRELLQTLELRRATLQRLKSTVGVMCAAPEVANDKQVLNAG